MPRYFVGFRGLIAVFAVILGLGCLFGAAFYFFRIGHLSTGPLSLASALAALSAVLAIVSGLLWAASLRYWNFVIKMEKKYQAEVEREYQVQMEKLHTLRE